MTILPIHIAAGVLALVFGYVALFAPKGATLHRKSGMLLYWLWRIRVRKTLRGLVGVSAFQDAALEKP